MQPRAPAQYPRPQSAAVNALPGAPPTLEFARRAASYPPPSSPRRGIAAFSSCGLIPTPTHVVGRVTTRHPGSARKARGASARQHRALTDALYGHRRTNADKRRCVEIALREFANKMSSNAIAKMCGVHDGLVASVRQTQLPESGSSTRLGLDGKERPARRAAAVAEHTNTQKPKSNGVRCRKWHQHHTLPKATPQAPLSWVIMTKQALEASFRKRAKANFPKMVPVQNSAPDAHARRHSGASYAMY